MKLSVSLKPSQPTRDAQTHTSRTSFSVPREGEHVNGDNNLSTLQPGSQHNQTKREREDPQTESEDTENQSQRKLRKKAPVDYRHLNDPFSDEEDMVKMYHMNTMAVYQAMIGPEDPSTLNEAQASSDWLEWEKAIHAELKQLAQFGMWKLIDCLSDAIPIPNKWVLRKKYNKLGELTKYKAHLMVKEYAQWLGFDFMDTFALVVRLETIRAVLAIVIAKNLKMQQMDVIGAYLNRYLKENVYMDQPNGYNNSTN